MVKNAALVVTGLLIGGMAGYHLRPAIEPVVSAGSSVRDDGGTAKKAARASGAAGAAGKSAGSAASDAGATPVTASLGERMKALLVDYNTVAAGKALESLSASDIQAALALVAAMPKSRDRDSLRWNLYRAWAKTNPNAAWKAALADPLETDNGTLLGAVAGELAKTKPLEALNLALTLGMGGRRAGVFQEVFDEWGKVDPAGVVAYANKHPDLPVRYWSVSNAIYQNWEKDPLSTANLALSLTDQQARSNAVSNLTRMWAGRDLNAALSWAQTISNPKLRQDAIASAIGGWASTDPQAAMTMASEIADKSARSSAMQSVFNRWLQKDPAAAMSFLGSANDEKLMEYLSWNFAYNTDGITAQEKMSLMEKLPDGKPKQEMFRSLASSQISSGHYNQAMELLNNMPDSSQRDSTVQQLGKQWAEADPKSAANWLKALPDSSDRDLAVAGFADALARTDPRAALQWADGIPDEGVKSGARKNIALRWLMADPVGGEAWLSSASGLSDIDKKMVRESAKQTGGGYTTFGVNVRKRR